MNWSRRGPTLGRPRRPWPSRWRALSRCSPTPPTWSWWPWGRTGSSRPTTAASSSWTCPRSPRSSRRRWRRRSGREAAGCSTVRVRAGEKGAIAAALSIMVGGDKAVFDQVLPVFQAMGKTITHLGPLGAGGFTKLANQIIVAGKLTALAEALALAAKAGLDIELTLKALGGGLAGSRCLDQKTPNYLAHSFNPGFKIDLHYKDLGLIMEAGRALGVPLPTTAVIQELFNALRQKGRGGLDHSGIITLLEDLAGVEVKGKK